WRWAAMLPLALVAAALETVGAAAVFVLIKVVSDPANVRQLPFASWIPQRITGGGRDAVLWISLAVAAFYVFKNAVLGFFAYMHQKVICDSEAALGRRMFEGYLALPYAMYLRRNSAEIVRNVSDSVTRVFERVLWPAVSIVTELLIVAGIVTVLIWTAPWSTVLAAGGLFGLLALLLKLTRRRIGRWGRAERRLKREVLETVQQTFGGFKEIRVMGRERFFDERFSRQHEELSRVLCLYETFSAAPRLIVETLFIFAMLLVLVLVTAQAGPAQAMPILGLCAYGGFRIVPSVNRLLLAWTSTRFGAAIVDQLDADLRLFELSAAETANGGDLALNDRIVLNGVRYAYDGAPAPALDELSLTIRRGESVGIVGATGAGKSTLVNIILGLLKPAAGTVTVDGRDIEESLRGWRRRIGYVPQEIYLFDDTLRHNIAFGRKDGEVDGVRLGAAVRMAQLEPFIASLPLGLDTIVGERGVRLSGGERQRVAIARALYSEPELLVLDEATSALDNRTERELARAIEALQGGRTLIIVAHRMTTVRRCDRLIFLRFGRIEAEGTFDALLQTNAEFRAMVSRYEAEEAAAAAVRV
ncbi:MAG TPA: ABC transporter ATP-binding protein, partial [Candidatus Binatia bacterium]|nr:ABC transporter ATP-binding protein [Candidatus Binatia bacterium]